jgi:hypothetical protein
MASKKKLKEMLEYLERDTEPDEYLTKEQVILKYKDLKVEDIEEGLTFMWDNRVITVIKNNKKL